MSQTKTAVAFAIAGLLAWTCLPAPGQNRRDDKADVQLQAAIHTEMIDGNWKAAIEQYKKVAQGKNRAAAAKALVHMGQCYDKLGDAEARKAYERVVREFADQKEAAAEARRRLAVASAGNGAGKGVGVRLLWDGAVSGDGTSSTDGRWLSFPNWETGDVGLRDLVKGESRLVTNKGGTSQGAEAESTAISPDGKRVAFVWCEWGKPGTAEYGCQLRVIGVDGEGERTLLDGKRYGNIVPKSWSPDSRQIVAVTGGRTLLLVPADGAPARTLPLSKDDRGVRECAITPDGKWLAFSVYSGEMLPSPLFVLPLDGSATCETEVLSDARLMGFSPDGRHLIYGRGKDDAVQLFLQPFVGGRVSGEARLFHSVYAHYNIPRGVTSDGSMIFTTENFPADVVSMSVDSATAVTGIPSTPVLVKAVGWAPFLGGGARFSPDGKKIAYAVRPRTVMIRSLADGSEHTITVQLRNVFGMEWAADSNSLFVAGPGPAGIFRIYRVDLTSGITTHVLDSARNQIMAPSLDGNTLYYLDNRTIKGRDLRTGVDRVVASPFGTERVLDMRISHDGKKLAAFRKSIWIVDLTSGQVKQIGTGAMGAAWSSDDRYVLAISARDKCCYSGRWDLVSYPVDGGEPVRQPLPEGAGDYRGLWLSPDGKQMATMRVNWLRQVWALENFLPKLTAAK